MSADADGQLLGRFMEMLSAEKGAADNTRQAYARDLDDFLASDNDVQLTGTIARDGVFAEVHTFSTARDLFGGAFDPEHAAWAADFPGSGHRTALEHLCNRLGGYAPDVVHHTDDALIMRALVASGQAVTILAALIATATSQVATRPIAEGAVHRTIFTAARASTVDAPAIQAVREALRNAARAATAGREDVKLLAE